MKLRALKYALTACVVSIFLATSALSIEGASIVKLTSVDDRMTVYVKGAEEVSGVTAMLGRYTGRDVTFHSASEANVRMKTLFLIDNSLSIPESSRSKIQEEVLKVIAARRENEFFAIGLIGERTTIIQEFTNDYLLLREALWQIVYQNQDAWLADTLYRFLSNMPFESGENDYIRIVLISDGMDKNNNVEHQYSRDELLSLLRDAPIPIYTLGVRNARGDNSEDLENLSALSRTTGASSFALNALSDTDALVSGLASDWDNLVIKLTVPDDAQDGSLQTLTLTLKREEESQTITMESVRMPLSEKTVGEEDEEDNADGAIQEDEEEDSMIPYIVIGVLGTLLVVTLVAVALLLKSRSPLSRRKEAPFHANAKHTPDEDIPTVHESRSVPPPREDVHATAMVDDRPHDGTVLVDEEDASYWITLTDIHDSARSFQKSMNDSLVIGLEESSDICVNYDPSVSRKHCELVRDGDKFSIINHSRSNGTIINGKKVHDPTPVSSGDTIKMGRVEMRLEISR